MQINELQLKQFDLLINQFQEEEIEDILIDHLQFLDTIDRTTPKPLVNRTVELLDRLDEVCEQKPLNGRIRKLRNKSFHARRTLTQFIHSKSLVQMNICCDFHQDNTGVLAFTLCETLKNKQPVIVTRSILSGKAIINNKETIQFLMKDTVAAKSRSYRIFQQNDAEWGDEFIVFLPCRDRKVKDDDLLSSYDLHPSLKRIGWDKAFEGPEGPVEFNALQALFIEKPKHPKVFALTGHGDPKYIAGIKKEDWTKKTLPFLTNQKTQFLMINSCSSGGKESLIHHEEQVPYPIVVCSIGDYTTSGTDEELVLTQRIFRRVFRHLKKSSSIQRQQIEKIVSRVKKEQPLSENQLKMLSPGSSRAPRGFIPLKDKSNDADISINDLRKHQLVGKGPMRFRVEKGALSIAPLLLPVSITLEGKGPFLLSALPGRAHHWIKELSLPEVNFTHFVIDHSNAAKITSEDKAFFIEEMHFENLSLKEMVLFFHDESLTLLFEMNGDSFVVREKNQMEISTPLRIKTTFEILLQTLPSEATVRHGIAGQDERECVITLIQERWKEDFDRLETLHWEGNIKNITSEEAEVLFIDAIQHSDINLIKEILSSFPEVIHLKDGMGSPQIFCALKLNDPELNTLILDCKPDFSLIDPKTNLSLFTTLVIDGDIDLLKKALSKHSINLNQVESSGWPPLFYALGNWELVDLLIGSGASPYILKNYYSISLLDHLVSSSAPIEQIMGWIEHAMTSHDIQRSPHALVLAAKHQRDDVIQLFIKKGLTPSGNILKERPKIVNVPLFIAMNNHDNTFKTLLALTTDEELAASITSTQSLGQFLLASADPAQTKLLKDRGVISK